MYTPGPYFVDDDLRGYDRVITSLDGRVVAVVAGSPHTDTNGHPSDQERDGTARLLSKAPQMHTALVDLLVTVSVYARYANASDLLQQNPIVQGVRTLLAEVDE